MALLVDRSSDKEFHDTLTSIDRQLQHISGTLNDRVNPLQQDETPTKAEATIRDQDRKRLKERLKEVMTFKHEALFDEKISQEVGIVERIFGICKPDGRLGKEGSRYSIFLLHLFS